MFSLFFLLLVLFFMPFFFINISTFCSVPLFSLMVSFTSFTSLSLFMLVFIFFSILLFSLLYMKGYPSLVYFWILKFLFVGSMLALMVSSSQFIFLLGWDGLGLTSYLLVSYYSSWDSSNSSMVTMLSNRVGDVFLIWGFCFFLFYQFCFKESFIYSGFPLLFALTALTKSSQFPFSSWLPQAMAAPTPVSSLVHSSTLVTAGVFLCLKFFTFFCSGSIMSVLFFSGWITCFVSGVMSLMESDGKKLVALSTLNQLGFMFIGLSSGNSLFVFFHLVSHAFFKSCMFIQVGILISMTCGSQDSRVYSFKQFLNPVSVFLFFGSVLSLLGFIFFSGFFSKEFLLGNTLYQTLKFSYFIMLFFCVMFTFFYSSRLLKMMVASSSISNFFESVTSFWPFSSFPLFLLGLSFGSFFFNNFHCFGVTLSFGELKMVFFAFFLLIFKELKTTSFLSSMVFQDNFYKSFTLLFTKKMFFLDYFVLQTNSKSLFFFSKLVLNSLGPIHFSLVFCIFLLLLML